MSGPAFCAVLSLLASIASGVRRTLGSSTFLSGVAALALGAGARAHGVELAPGAEAAIPLAVGWKEAKRREVESNKAELYAHLDRAHDESDALRAELEKLKAERSASAMLGEPNAAQPW